MPAPRRYTGMGLERGPRCLQGVHANYDTDLFQALFAKAPRETIGQTSDREPPQRGLRPTTSAPALPLIADGVIPATKAAATCCAGSSAAPSAMAKLGAQPPSSTNWSRSAGADGRGLSRNLTGQPAALEVLNQDGADRSLPPSNTAWESCEANSRPATP